MVRLLIARHGQTEWNVQGRNQGHTDMPLDEIGIMQSKELAEALSQQELSKIYCSTLLRAVSTAEFTSEKTGVKIEFDDRLRERDYGEWEGKTREEVIALFPNTWINYSHDPAVHRADGGESGIDVFSRCFNFVIELLKNTESGQNILLVSHGGTIAHLLSVLIDATPATAASLRFRNCSITEFEIQPNGKKRLARIDDVSHLSARLRELVHDAKTVR